MSHFAGSFPKIEHSSRSLPISTDLGMLVPCDPILGKLLIFSAFDDTFAHQTTQTAAALTCPKKSDKVHTLVFTTTQK